MLAEFFGLLLGVTLMTAKVGLVVLNPFDGVGVQEVAVAYEKFCTQDLRGKWEPKPTGAESCPGGKWSNIVTAAPTK